MPDDLWLPVSHLQGKSVYSKRLDKLHPYPHGLFLKLKEVLEPIQSVELGDQLMWR